MNPVPKKIRAVLFDMDGTLVDSEATHFRAMQDLLDEQGLTLPPGFDEACTGMTVAAVVCIVEREEAHGRPAVEAAANGAPFLRLFTAAQVRAEHVKQLGAAKS